MSDLMVFSGKRFRRSDRRTDARMMANEVLSSSSTAAMDGVDDGSAVVSSSTLTLTLTLTSAEADADAAAEAATGDEDDEACC